MRKSRLFRMGWWAISCWLGIYSCQKDTSQLPVFRAIELPTTDDLRGVFFLDKSRGFVVGGSTWQRGFILSTTDGGKSWQTDTLVTKILEDIHFDSTGRGYVCGLDGMLLTLPPKTRHWQMIRQDYLWYRAVYFLDENLGLLVGGEGWKNGTAARFSSNFVRDTTVKFPNELDAVCFLDENIALAVGMGQVLRSDDGGKNWLRNDGVPNDFYRSIQFLDAKTGFVCGFAGTILKTIDGGKTWQILRNGNNITHQNAPFRSIRFADEKTGFVAGENGCFWQTIDGGNTWQTIEHLGSDAHFTKIFVGQGWGWLTAEQGKCFYFEF